MQAKYILPKRRIVRYDQMDSQRPPYCVHCEQQVVIGQKRFLARTVMASYRLFRALPRN